MSNNHAWIGDVLYCYWVICFEMKDRFEAKGMTVSLKVLTALGVDGDG